MAGLRCALSRSDRLTAVAGRRSFRSALGPTPWLPVDRFAPLRSDANETDLPWRGMRFHRGTSPPIRRRANPLAAAESREAHHCT